MDFIVDLIQREDPRGHDIADKLYKKVNDILDNRIEHNKQIFAEQGTHDFDAAKFCVGAQFLQNEVDPGLTAAMLVAAIYRLARQ
jgi:hypothetical protein